MKTVVITGGIGSGKSEACRYLSTLGVPVYDADSRTKELYDRCPGLVDDLEDALCSDGQTLRDVKGSLDRRLLASIIFNDASKMATLESIVHPAVLRDFLTWRDAQAAPALVFESAIFPDKPLFHSVADVVIVVECPVEKRILRAMKRDSASRSDIERRIKAQSCSDLNLGEAVPVFHILNDGTLQDLHRKLSDIWDSI